MLALYVELAQFLDPNRGPDQSGGFRVSPSFFIVLFGIGAVVAAVGHLARSRALIAAGIALIFLSTVFIPIALQLTR